MNKKIQAFIAKWDNYEFESSGVTTDDYKLFEREFRGLIKRIAASAGLTVESFNKGHYEFSVILKTENKQLVYVSIGDVRCSFRGSWNYWADKILHRTMGHCKDYSGGRNNFCSLLELNSALNSYK